MIRKQFAQNNVLNQILPKYLNPYGLMHSQVLDKVILHTPRIEVRSHVAISFNRFNIATSQAPINMLKAKQLSGFLILPLNITVPVFTYYKENCATSVAMVWYEIPKFVPYTERLLRLLALLWHPNKRVVGKEEYGTYNIPTYIDTTKGNIDAN